MAATHEPGTGTDVGPTVVSDRLTLRLLAPADVPAVLAYQVANAAHLAPTSPLPPPGYLTEAFWRERVERDRADAAVGAPSAFSSFRTGSPAGSSATWRSTTSPAAPRSTATLATPWPPIGRGRG
jgi:RimJ/RimL family protein N-acetyltransferase